MKYPCGCDVGPGRLEGEGPITAYIHNTDDCGNGTDDLSFGDGSWAALLTDGLADAWTAEDKAALQEEGYCDACVADAEVEYREAKAITYGSSSDGFLWSTTWDDADKAQAAYDADLALLTVDEGEDE